MRTRRPAAAKGREGTLTGLDAYLSRHYASSVFDALVLSKAVWEVRAYPGRILRGRVMENRKFEILFLPEPETGAPISLNKIDIGFLYPAEASGEVCSLLKKDPKVEALDLKPIVSSVKRFHIKNKSLFPLMKDRVVLFFTLLEGDVLRGLISEFSRYEITLHLKGGLCVVLLRHAVFDVRDKKGRSYLKSFQNIHRDWEKSSLYVP